MIPRPCRAAPGLLGLLLGLSVAPNGVGAGPVADEANLQRGREVYERCIACHAIDTNRTGPKHCGLFGRRAGTAPGFEGYSPALRASGIVWNEQTLGRFLENPPAVVPQTFMTYAGVPDEADRAALVAWLAKATRPGESCARAR
jgi:cytochrome c